MTRRTQRRGTGRRKKRHTIVRTRLEIEQRHDPDAALASVAYAAQLAALVDKHADRCIKCGEVLGGADVCAACGKNQRDRDVALRFQSKKRNKRS